MHMAGSIPARLFGSVMGLGSGVVRRGGVWLSPERCGLDRLGAAWRGEVRRGIKKKRKELHPSAFSFAHDPQMSSTKKAAQVLRLDGSCL